MANLPKTNIHGEPLNKFSTQFLNPIKGPRRPMAEAQSIGAGIKREQFITPQVLIIPNWWEGNTCNFHLLDQANIAKKSIEDAGMLGLIYSIPGVSDGRRNGTDAMRHSLYSRNWIANGVEMGAGEYGDALLAIPGCDKNIPGVLMGGLRVNRPMAIVSGGSIAPGKIESKGVVTFLDIVNAIKSEAQRQGGDITLEEQQQIIDNACPGEGGCGGMYTFNTMLSSYEALGITPLFSSSNLAASEEKKKELANIGALIGNMLVNDIKPKDIVTRNSLLNAITVVMALGGSTNAVLHYLAIARTAEADLDINDFQLVSDKVPTYADMQPFGTYRMADLSKVGGTPAVLKFLLEKGHLNGDTLTVTGSTLEEELTNVEPLHKGQKVFLTNNPKFDSGIIKILDGNLGAGYAVAKITGTEGRFVGPANVYNSEAEAIKGYYEGDFEPGQVIVVRYEGLRGAPGMPEMLTLTSLIAKDSRLENKVAFLTDARFSGGSHGHIVSHVHPEAYDGGMIALIEKGDTIVIDGYTKKLDLMVENSILDKRRNEWKQPKPRETTGNLSEFARLATPAPDGGLTDRVMLREYN